MTIQTCSHVENFIAIMENESAKVDLPKFYKGDLESDYRTIRLSPNKTYIWLLRKCGSVLFPCRSGISPIFIEHFLMDKPTKVYLLNCSENKIDVLNNKELMKYLYEPPFDVAYCYSANDLIKKVKKLLEDPNISRKAFHEPKLSTDFLNWGEWQQWFKNDNAVMYEFMEKAIAKLISLK
ncbi:TPA: hypothetical protein ACX6S7_002426 [Photobacterium damselae]